ncbi:arsenite methyltransferase [Haloarcula amylovorans]|uniref:arsenite methyltransferase n=1 Tax=Haloarcula amylovorans TaxID=2562280 RepID=UPI00107647FD|nr:arsenite methyltransferase [Halomicroarcula amylolytica]
MSEQPNPDSTTGGLASDEQRRAVRRRYRQIANESSSCCSDSDAGPDERLTRQLGYSEDQETAVADGANLGLGCGNPNAIAALQPGETVLDLGSGAGFDCFLAGQEVGDTGHVIGVDMTPAMIEKARENVATNDVRNVEFRLGEIEHLPVADETVDVIISNCVINLSPDKQQVFHEAYRALRPGGRLAISDVVLTAELPEDVHADPESVASCVAGALPIVNVERMLSNAGFEAIQVESDEASEEFIREWDADRDVSEYVVSATIEATKPA